MASRVHSATADIRALGVGAPLRAGYEASKRFGGHTLVFRHLVTARRNVAEGQSPFVVRGVPDEVRKRTMAAADRVVSGTIELFGQPQELGDPPAWHDIIHTDGSWPAVDWWRIDLRSDSRPGDVKWAWELGRHRHLVILARAANLDPSDKRYLTTLERHLASWIETNPPETGVHWYSNLEIALRAIAWLQVLALVGDRLRSDLRAALWRHLHHSGRHLIADLPYAVSTMRNNHLLGDGLGLIALGRAFGGKTGRRWHAIGDWMFTRQLRRHMNLDGSMIEDSLSYHRFVLEMLTMRVVLCSASEEDLEAMKEAAQFLARLGTLDGSVPQYGDWDEGRVFAVSEDPTDLAGSVRLALALAGDGAPGRWRNIHDEVAWFADEGTPVLPEPAVVDGTDVGGGISRTAAGPFTVWLKGGSGPSHGHADLSSVAIAYQGNWLIGDPGTGTYNGPIEQRNYFRSSGAHNVLRLEGEDQLVPHRAFRWRYTADGAIGEPVRLGDRVVMWTVHDAYSRLSPRRRVVRVVVVGPVGVDITDHVEGSSESVELALPFPPHASWNESESTIEIGSRRFELGLPTGDVTPVRGSQAPYAGWWSATYGSAEPATILQIWPAATGTVHWSIHDLGMCTTESADAGMAPLTASVVFEETTVRLRVEVGGRTFLRSV